MSEVFCFVNCVKILFLELMLVWFCYIKIKLECDEVVEVLWEFVLVVKGVKDWMDVILIFGIVYWFVGELVKML